MDGGHVKAVFRHANIAQTQGVACFFHQFIDGVRRRCSCRWVIHSGGVYA